MTIITADGTKYRRDGMIFRNLRRILRTVIFLILALITSAAIIGFIKAANAPTARTQDDTVSFNDGWDTGLSDLRGIASQPGGITRINNCLSTTTTVDALHSCLDR